MGSDPRFLNGPDEDQMRGLGCGFRPSSLHQQDQVEEKRVRQWWRQSFCATSPVRQFLLKHRARWALFCLLIRL